MLFIQVSAQRIIPPIPPMPPVNTSLVKTVLAWLTPPPSLLTGGAVGSSAIHSRELDAGRFSPKLLKVSPFFLPFLWRRSLRSA